MKKWSLLAVLLVFTLLVPNYANASVQTNSADFQLQGSNTLSHNFAEKNGEAYYVNNGMLKGKKSGIYKISKDMKTYTLIKQGDFNNISIYGNGIFVYNYATSTVQQYSLTGKLIKNYPSIKNPKYVISNNVFFYMTERGFFKMNLNGYQNKFLLKPKGSIQEFTVSNGFIYFVQNIPLTNDPESSVEYLAKVSTNGAKNETILMGSAVNIDSIIVKNGSIYAVIHKTDVMQGRKLFKMTLDGKNLKQVSTLNMSKAFVGSKYIYYQENSSAAKQSIYRITLEGKNNTKIATAAGSISGMGYFNKNFYLEVQPPNSYNFVLQKVAIK